MSADLFLENPNPDRNNFRCYKTCPSCQHCHIEYNIEGPNRYFCNINNDKPGRTYPELHELTEEQTLMLCGKYPNLDYIDAWLAEYGEADTAFTKIESTWEEARRVYENSICDLFDQGVK